MSQISAEEYSKQKTEKEHLLRSTASCCPVCLRSLSARIITRDGNVLLEKDCPEHGSFTVLISAHAEDYRVLQDWYFYFLSKPMIQKEYYLNITTRCNIKCPVCYLDYYKKVDEMSEKTVGHAASFSEIKRFTFSHGEPTASDNLFRNIKILKESGKIVNMHTNALKISDYAYAKSLKESGIDHVSVQFDGFAGQAHKGIRGTDVRDVKLKALENLKKLRIPVTLNPTISKSINTSEIGSILDFAAKEMFIKDISFITYSHYRKDKEGLEDYIMPDEVLDLLAAQSGGLISREEVIDFQKVFFAYMSVFKKRKCFYYFHYFLVRNRSGLRRIGDYIDLKKMIARLERLKTKGRELTVFKFLVFLFFSLKPRVLSFSPRELFDFWRGGYPREPGKLLSITLATICDPYKYDKTIAANCGQGIIDDKQKHESYGSFLVENMER